jgi:PKD repeat protein
MILKMKPISLSLLLLVVLLISPAVVAYTIKPVDLPSNPGFSWICHPSYDDFLASTMSANMTSDRTEGDAPFRVRFYDTSYGDYDQRLWNFGDGNTSDDRNPVHLYREPGKYDVSLTIFKNYTYETSLSEYLNNSKGEFTDMMWQSTDRKLDYITVYERGTGVKQDVPEDWYPEQLKAVRLPSGAEGVTGSASFSGSEITIYNSSVGHLTDLGYEDTLDVDGVYNIVKSVPYNSGL